MEQAIASLDQSTQSVSSPVDLRFSLVPPTEAANIRDQIEPFMKRACDRSGGRYGVEDVYDSIAAGRCHLWIVFEPGMKIVLALTTVFSVFPKSKWLTVQFAGGGELNRCKRLVLSTLERFAKDNDCAGVEAVGRAGWSRRVASLGYQEQHRFYEKRI